jgi:hypothetical protein
LLAIIEFKILPPTRKAYLKMSKSIVGSTPYPFNFDTQPVINKNKSGNAVDLDLRMPNVRGRVPSAQASRLRTLALEAHNDPSKILAQVCTYDALSGRLVEEAGFPVLFMAGYAMASALGLPDTGYIAFQEVAAKIQETARVVSIPIIADGDTGYGSPMNVRRTVQG